MKLLIEIDDEIYKFLNKQSIEQFKIDNVLKAIANGTVIPKGHWIMKNPSPYEPWRCSNCNSVGNNLYNYCPNCGAKMEADEESE